MGLDAGIPQRSGEKAGHKPRVEINDQLKLFGGNGFAKLHKLGDCREQIVGPLRFVEADNVVYLGMQFHDLATCLIGERCNGSIRITLFIQRNCRHQDGRNVAEAH